MDDLDRNRAAKRLVNDPAYKIASDALLDETVKAWAYTDDPEVRERCWQKQRGLTELQSQLEEWAKLAP